MLRIVASEQAELDALKLDLDALVCEGARRMLLTALKAEVDEYVAQHADHRDEVGHALVVRNGVAELRTVTTAAGELEIQGPASTRSPRGASIHERNPATLGTTLPQSHGRAAGAVSAWHLDQGL